MKYLLASALIVACLAIGTIEAHRRGGRIPDQKHLRAPFLKGLNQTFKDEYHKIVENQASTKRQFRDAVEKFALTLPAENKKLYADWKEKHESKAKEFQSALATKALTLSPAAQDLAKKIHALHENLDLTRAQERDQIHELKQAAPEAVRKELKSILPQHPFNKAHGGRHGGHGKDKENKE
uniref:ANIS5_cation-bd domain-containing protein n=1 Tax=Panagrellus redivivus TaxID=6233 RepID=A0A7E4ZTH4_PANRE